MSIESGGLFKQSDAKVQKRRDFIWEHNPPNQEEYYEDKAQDMISGVLTWVVRDFAEEHGRIYDLVYKKRAIGYLDARYGIDVIGHIPPMEGFASAVSLPGSFFEVLDTMELFAIERLGALPEESADNTQ